jgi:guanylate kinase
MPGLNLKRRGLLLILSSPSGAGKSTLTRNLVREDRGIRLSISVTTRQRRPSEIDGQIVEKMRKDVVSVFVLPPSMPELRARLERRAEDTPEVIARRLRNAREEIAQWESYDYVLVNDDLDRTFSDLKAILAAERLRRERQIDLGSFVPALLAEEA